MTSAQPPSQQVPPDIARYLRGETPQTRQFDFLIGDWNVSGSRFKPDGTLLLEYQAKWTARHLNQGRMVFDDFKALSPAGTEISSYVTLRTYSETTQRWQMSGLAALQPAAVASWVGEWRNGEMQTLAVGKDPAGNSVRNRIRFFRIEQSSFSWESSLSLDDGKTWFPAASLLATRAAP